jgi:hypothetical protein
MLEEILGVVYGYLQEWHVTGFIIAMLVIMIMITLVSWVANSIRNNGG